MALVDTTVEQSLPGDERMCECVVSRRCGGWGVGGLLSGRVVHAPLGGSTEGACQVLCPARQQGGSNSVALPLVVKRIVCAAVAASAPTATPASVRIDSRCPAPQVDYRVG